jgi:lipopolysaccharide export system permease protein
MGICEMQRRLWSAQNVYAAAEKDYNDAVKRHEHYSSMPTRVKTPEPHGIGWAYCTLLQMAFPPVKEAHAADVRSAALHQEPAARPAQDTSAKARQAQDTSTKKRVGATPIDTSVPQKPVVTPAAAPAAAGQTPGPVPVTPGALPPSPQVRQQIPPNLIPPADTLKSQAQIAAEAAAAVMRGSKSSADIDPSIDPRLLDAKIRLEIAQRQRDRYEIEIDKKFSLAAACLIFCIVGPPIALRFPRGGVGLVIGVSLAVFALYYVGLIGGESLANKGYVPPFWAMWGTNVIMTLVGIVMLIRMGRDSGSGRDGGIREWLDERRLLREERRAAELASAA